MAMRSFLQLRTRPAIAAAVRPHALALRALHTEVRREGEPESPECRYFFHDSDGRKLSPWHDIPLIPSTTKATAANALTGQSNNIFNFINEIPRGARAKMEIAGDEAFNPIKQDVNKFDAPRFYHFDSLVNYGCLPQTWEDPLHIDASTQLGGDNDPIDVLEIGQQTMRVGDVYAVKVLGVLGMIDDGETDWKVIAINVNDPLAETLHDVSDLVALSTELADIVPQLHRWFRDYKLPDGNQPSEFAFNGEAQSRDFAVDVILQTHASWQQLVRGDQERMMKPTLWTGTREARVA